MAGPERIEWRRNTPSRSLATLGWYGASAALVIAIAWLLFGGEPARLNSGQPNPLAVVPVWTTVLAGLGAVLPVLAVARRPMVAASHYALTVRPGWIRAIVLPWAGVAEVAIAEVDGEGYLLVRVRRAAGTAGMQLNWLDRPVLRALGRDGSRLGRRYDVAVRMRDFVGAPDSQLAALAAFAPDQVLVTDAVAGR